MGDCPKKDFTRGEINRFIHTHTGLHEILFQQAYMLSVIHSTDRSLSSS